MKTSNDACIIIETKLISGEMLNLTDSEDIQFVEQSYVEKQCTLSEELKKNRVARVIVAIFVVLLFMLIVGLIGIFRKY